MKNKQRVPHCRECDRCKYIQMPWSNTKEYKCYEDANSNEWETFIDYLGVDTLPKTSPIWCPKRKEEEK